MYSAFTNRDPLKPTVALEELARALSGTQKRFNEFHKRIHDLGDPGWLSEIWSNGMNYADYTDNPEFHREISNTIGKWYLADADCFGIGDNLRVWTIKELCNKRGVFKYPSGHEAFCFQFLQDTPYAVKLGKSSNGITVWVNKNAQVPLEMLLDGLVKNHAFTQPNYDTMHRFWKKNDKKFDWYRLPTELKFMVVEEINEPVVRRPYHYDRKMKQGKNMFSGSISHLQVMREALHCYSLNQIDLIEGGATGVITRSDPAWAFTLKTVIRGNTFWFHNLDNFNKWILNLEGSYLNEVRTVHLNFSHGEFMKLWTSEVQPSRHEHSKYVDAAKKLGNMYLERLIIEPQLSEDMRLHKYFNKPTQFGCHMQAVRYVCGLASRHLHRAKTIELAGMHWRPHWQPLVNDMFRKARNGEPSDHWFSRKQFETVVSNPKMEAVLEREKDEVGGGVSLSTKNAQASPALTNAVGNDQASSPESEASEEEERPDSPIWRCKCHDKCHPDYFNNADPPPPPPPKPAKKYEKNGDDEKEQGDESEEGQEDGEIQENEQDGEGEENDEEEVEIEYDYDDDEEEIDTHGWF
ncbi:hypothetical protein GTA08_BOTSDO04725 [Neofusicoccum parvum]|nr:hypothetical protein GTA08_BOTSDO04725 [Neofusicoccum parvum]